MDSEPQPASFVLPVVRDEPLQPRTKRPVRAVFLHILRISIVVLTLVLIRQQHHRFLANEAARQQKPVALEVLREFFSEASEGGLFDPERRTQQVVDSGGRPLGFIVQTSPQADGIVGFSGPTNVLIAFGTDDRILGLKILWSRDTREHVDLIERQAEFLNSWKGTLWADAASKAAVDGVSGATLTSLAIAESIATRLGGSVPSLRFPEEVTASEVVDLFPNAVTLSPDTRRPALLRVVDASGSLLGFVFRTSPSADNLIGYQGPTDTLVTLDKNEKVIGLRLRHSFDNEPYVGYVKDEEYFLTLFNGRSLADLAALDVFEARIEGVSGATMTSMTVADALVLAARQAMTEIDPATTAKAPSILSFRWFSTMTIVLAGLAIGITRLRKFRLVRLAILGGVIAILGTLNGDMLSQATLIGWTQNDVPWQLAGGLVVVSAVALLVPVFSKKQIYCHQLCPHGAVQQLARKRVRWQWTVPRWLRQILPLLPYSLLAWCIVVSMLHLPFSLVDLEPFDAWVFQAAGTATIAIAVIGLGASLFLPMAYCRYGCPTGALLNFLRFNSRSDIWSRSDWLATSLVLLAILLSVAAPTGSVSASDFRSTSEPVQTWLTANKSVLQWLTAFSTVLFVCSLLAVPWLVARIPANYFVRSSDDESAFRHRHPLVTLSGRLMKNLLGGVILLAGIAMLILPGQGLLTILLGIMLLDFPGKRRMEISIIRRPAITQLVHWIRQKAGQQPLLLPDEDSSE